MRLIIQKTVALHPRSSEIYRQALPTFRNANICMHLYAFTSALSLALHHILASLVKGRWIDGKAQTVALLRFTCDTPAFFIHQTFLPSRRRDCSVAPNPATLTSIFSSNILITSKFNFSVNNIACLVLLFHSLDFPSET